MPIRLKVDIGLSPVVENMIRNHRHLVPDAIEKGMEFVGREGAKRVRESIITKSLVQSGKLRDSISYDVKPHRGSLKTVIGSNVFYAHMLEGGSSPSSFSVKPRTAKALYWPGAAYPVKIVKNNPGGRVRAYRFLGETIEEMEQVGTISDLFSKGLQEAIDDLVRRGF
jgi:phage gpG-like protein